MKSIRFEPSLSRCVQTIASEEYDRIKNEMLLSGHARETQADELEMLREFLATVDFGTLRCEYEPAIMAGRRVMITLFRSDQGVHHLVEIS